MSPRQPNDQNGRATNKCANVNVLSQRFSDIPSTLDIAVHLEQKVEVEDDAHAVEIYFEDLSDPNELCSLLEIEHAAPRYWMTIALAYAKQGTMEDAIKTLVRAGNLLQEKESRRN
ncbi:hypothetical protein ONS96_004341 [Cadophora gregata f. sp. sojae]|nr:hypothetical protein ONS96_004341 [Cadophora gregata f. sp. sojae]